MICDTEFTSVRTATCCSERCRQISRSNNKLTGVAGYDYIQCPICKQRVRQITQRHAQTHGYTDAADMAHNLSIPNITCEKIRERVQGVNNPGYNHGGKFSKFSKNFVHGYDTAWHQQWASDHSKFRNENKHLFKTNIEYWIDKSGGNPELAEQLYKDFQVRNLDYFVDKYGTAEGKIRHQQKIEKWIKSMPKCNFSMVSQTLFDCIMERYAHDGNIYYATYNRDNMTAYENKEYRLKVEGSYVLPDFIDLTKRKIIEFDGDYWHSEAKVNPAREQLREEKIRNEGYDILRVREQDYKHNAEQVIQECLNFLTA
jgi:very-short-patch-repair endonuclease